MPEVYVWQGSVEVFVMKSLGRRVVNINSFFSFSDSTPVIKKSQTAIVHLNLVKSLPPVMTLNLVNLDDHDENPRATHWR